MVIRVEQARCRSEVHYGLESDRYTTKVADTVVERGGWFMITYIADLGSSPRLKTWSANVRTFQGLGRVEQVEGHSRLYWRSFSIKSTWVRTILRQQYRFSPRRVMISLCPQWFNHHILYSVISPLTLHCPLPTLSLSKSHPTCHQQLFHTRNTG